MKITEGACAPLGCADTPLEAILVVAIAFGIVYIVVFGGVKLIDYLTKSKDPYHE